MRIAFDVDGVMTNLAKFQLDTGRKYFGEKRCLNDFKQTT